MLREYDTREGIEKILRDGLQGLNKLRDLRHQAGYGRGERMGTWVIYGRWVTDACGNFGRIVEGAPVAAFPRFPPVMSIEEVQKEWVVRLLWGMQAQIPPAHVRCPECQKPFSLADAHTCLETYRDVSEVLPEGQVGKTVCEINDLWSWCSALELRRVVGVCNPAWVDLTPHPDAATKDYAKGWVVNDRGWRECSNTGGSRQIGLDEPLPGESTVSFTVREWFHAGCLKERRRRQEREFFARVLKLAGIGEPAMTEIPNEYWRDDGPPWFLVDLGDRGFLKIGWRKRVISIDWSDFGEGSPDGSKLFADEGVTTGRHLVHAWGEEKCVEYLRDLMDASEHLKMKEGNDACDH